MKQQISTKKSVFLFSMFWQQTSPSCCKKECVYQIWRHSDDKKKRLGCLCLIRMRLEKSRQKNSQTDNMETT